MAFGFQKGAGSSSHFPKNDGFSKQLSQRLAMQRRPQSHPPQTDVAHGHDLHPSHGSNFCGLSGLTFPKTRSLFLSLRINRMFMTTAHNTLPWGAQTLHGRG